MPSFKEAIEEKYHRDNFNCSKPPDGSFVIFAPKSLPLAKNSLCPPNLVLSNCGIDSAGKVEELKHGEIVDELDISHNALTDCKEVCKVLHTFPNLKFLNWSFNNLSQTSFNYIQTDELNLDSLNTLVLVGTNISWGSIWRILTFTKNARELHLSKNEFKEVVSPDVGMAQFFSIEKLMFDSNPVNQWEEIEKLGKAFPSLKHLNLSDCPLRLTGLVVKENFSNLLLLNMSSTLIATQEEFEKINVFSELQEIRLIGLPYLKNFEEKEKRQIYIALLPKIKRLNGGADISHAERDTAERFFIRSFLDAESKPKKYFELVEKHGQLHPLLDLNLKPTTKVKLTVVFGEQSFRRDVNLKQTVREFKKNLEPILGIPISKMKLYYVDLGLNGYDWLRFPDKQLFTYNMRDGDEIHVQSTTDERNDSGKD